MKRKGQIAGEVFIYIMAAIIIGAIALIGYNAVKTMMQKSCDAEKVNFKGEIENLIDKFTSYGSINTKSLKAPCEYSEVCFVDKTQIGKTNFNCLNNMIIQNTIRDNINNNIFVISGKSTIPIGYSDLISVAEVNKTQCICVKARNGNLNIVFKGKGSSSEISSG